jgi:hypothetical protein
MLRRGPSNSFAAASAKARSAMACKFGTAARSSLSPSSYGELAIVFCSCTCDVSYHCAVVQIFGRARRGHGLSPASSVDTRLGDRSIVLRAV